MNRLKELRLERGYTQIKTQMLTGIDQSDYSKIERGVRYYTFEQCVKIAKVLNTSMDYLAGLTDVKEPYPTSKKYFPLHHFTSCGTICLSTFSEINIMNFFKGVVTGLGAIAPGLSGSVLLVLFGLYQKTITAISSTVKSFFDFIFVLFRNIKNPKAVKASKSLKAIGENLKFLIPLALGILLGVFLFSKLVDFLLMTFPMETRFGFFGFILGSVPLFYKEVKKEGFNKKYYIVMAISFALGVLLFYFSGNSFSKVENPSFLQSVVLGITVATSYIVPGVDSAAILSALGMYELWVESLADLNLSVLLPAVIGLGAGLLVVSFIINKLLDKYYTLTFSVIFGLFISIVPKVLDESCVVGLNIKTLISVIILIVCFILSLLFGNLDKLASKKK